MTYNSARDSHVTLIRGYPFLTAVNYYNVNVHYQVKQRPYMPWTQVMPGHYNKILPAQRPIRASTIVAIYHIQMATVIIIKTFTFKDQNDYEYEIWFKVFSRSVKKWTPQNTSLHFFSPEKLVLLSLLEEVKPFPDRKMIKLLTFDNLFPSL